MRGRRRGAAARSLATAAVALLLALPAAARAQQIATIHAGFSPYRLGAPTALTLGFRIRAADGGLPAALTAISYRFPRALGLATNELGLASCNPRALRLHGPKACPPDSIMGHGSALAELQVSPRISSESARLALVAGPSANGYLKLLISATAAYPISARLVMSTLLLPGRLQITVPVVPGVPEGPDLAVARVRLTIGGRLTYYERRHGRRVAYHPQGILLPRRCPRGGFRFGATFSFLDGTQARARTVVACPPQRRRHRHERRSRRRG